jgi:Zn-dependent protease
LTQETTAVRPTPAPGSGLLVGLISTALLFAWIAWNLGWIWALAGVVGVFVHEYGHVLAINAVGAGPGRIHIVPFFGGAASWSRPPSSEFKSVLIALAGPVFGLVAMAPFFMAFAVTGQNRWLGGAFFIASINLFNLAPAPPLDGSKALGPALARIHPWLERAAMLLVGALVLLWAILHREYFIALFVGLSALRAFSPGALRPPAEPLTGAQWLLSLTAYGLAIGLCLGAVSLTTAGSGVDVTLRALNRLFGG